MTYIEDESKDDKLYEYDAVNYKTPDINGAYVVFPYDLRAEFGAG